MRSRIAALTGWKAGAVLFAAGLIAGLGFAPLHIQPAYLLALCLLVLMLDDGRRSARPMRAGFWRGWCFSAGLFLAGTFWVANAFIERGMPYALFFWVPIILMPAGLALFWGGAGALYTRFALPGPGRIVLFAALLMAGEYLRSTILSGFPWNLPGHVWAAGGPVSQTASVIGASGLSALTLLIFASPAALDGAGPKLQRALPAILAVITLTGVTAFGHWRLGATAVEETGHTVRVVKLGLTQSQRTYENRAQILEDYLALSGGPDLDEADALIWPEGALPALTLREPELLTRMSEELAGTPLILGTTRAETGVTPYLYYNALAVLDFTAEGPVLAAVYDKSRLVPFGEANPVRVLTQIFGFTSLSRNSPFFTPGPGAQLVELDALPAFAPLICYEVIYPGYVSAAPARPAWLLNISNDSWFGASSGPYQHFNIARYRAIETGLPLVRAASAGVSGLVDPLGRGTQLTGLKSSEALNIRILAALDNPFYARWGDAPWGIGLLLLLFSVQLLPRYRGMRRSAK